MAHTTVSKPARTTPDVRVSYPVVTAQQLADAKKRNADPESVKPGIVLMFDKKRKDHMDFLKVLHGDAQAVLAEAWPDESKRPRYPLIGKLFKDGDTGINNKGIPLKEKNPEYEGHYILRVSSRQLPAVVNRARQKLADQQAVYGGCFCKVNINAYSFSGTSNAGVTFGLNGVQKWAEGESFGGGRPALESMFDADPLADPLASSAGASADPFAAKSNPVGDEIPF